MRSTECRGDESCELLMVRFYLRPAWPNGCPTWVAEPSLTVQISLDSWREPTVSSRRSNAFRMERDSRSEEHTSELQSLMRISYAVFCLKKKTHIKDLHKKYEQTT